MDVSQGVAAVVPDWDDVRLLAPHAELRLLACGQASLIAPHRLRYCLGPISLLLSTPTTSKPTSDTAACLLTASTVLFTRL